MQRHLPIATLVATVLAAGSVSAIADGEDGNPPGSGSVQIAAIEPQAKQSLAVLRDGRSAGDALREDIAVRMDRRASFGLNPGLSRLAVGNATFSVYIIPARGHVCASLMDTEGASLICPSTDEVVSGKAYPGTAALQTGGVAVYGIVPDGVDSVSVQTGTSSSIDVATERNAYYTVIPSGVQPRALSYVGPSGHVEFPISDPALVLEEGRPSELP